MCIVTFTPKWPTLKKASLTSRWAMKHERWLLETVFLWSLILAMGAVCKEAGVLIDVFSPMREDFLEGNNK